MKIMATSSTTNRPVILWLSLLCLMVFSMVLVGGITRLTHSGLSIAEWKPVTGILPPGNETEWQEEFATYQKTPEYLKVNAGMSLSEFKSIFFWEYFHRLLGRLIGIAFIIPYAFFLFRRRLQARLSRRLLLGFFLGGLEGVMGWLMVKSGLVDNPHVSHYRLAAHLLLALAIFGYFFWIIMDLCAWGKENMALSTSLLKKLSLALLAGLVLEIICGAFTAGLRAGIGYNTFPMMNGYWIPPDTFHLSPLWMNFLENRTTIQWTHRLLALALFLGIAGFRFYASRSPLTKTQRRAVNLLVAVLVLQITLGILTLVYVVPVGLGVLHQAGAFVLFAALMLVYRSFAASLAK